MIDLNVGPGYVHSKLVGVEDPFVTLQNFVDIYCKKNLSSCKRHLIAIVIVKSYKIDIIKIIFILNYIVIYSYKI